MYKLEDLRQATPVLQPLLHVAPVALLIATLLVTGCKPPPAAGEQRGQTGRCVPMDPTSTYAVYWSKNKVEAIELIPTGLQRCIVAVSQPPSAPPSSSTPPTTPSCPAGQIPTPAAAYFVDYYKGEPVALLQIEALQGSRCIIPLPDISGSSECPPPAGYHIVVINGRARCVPI